MNLESKYDIGDIVVSINRGLVRKWVPCAFCNATGVIWGNDDTSRHCPECWDKKGKYIYELKPTWSLGDGRPYSLTIGKISIEYESEDSHKITYMCQETGVGSGTNWGEEFLWPSEAEAQYECSRLNNLHQKGEPV